MTEEFEIFKKPYQPAESEKKAQELWDNSGFYNPDICIEKGLSDASLEPFSMVLPPPNVTGSLHTGHALMLSIQDIMVRFARMQGRPTLWLPGTDHAAIATQSKVEKILEKEKIRKHDLGRDEFLARVEQYARESHDTIVTQTKAMGASLDWSREAFTLDEQRNFAVRTAFKKMFDDGLIYRGDRIVNWDPKGQTNISDDEIIYKEEKTKFYYLQYGPFRIGTARPETKFGDKYVVMHPDDPRYAEYSHGQTIELEWINGPISATIIKDEVIDMEFGTGVMTITPWHSQVDYEIAERHNLEKEQIIDYYGKLLPIAGEFAGMKINEARDKIIEKLDSKGLLVKMEDYTHNIATAERTGATIEPQIRKQWFIDVNKKILLQNSELTGVDTSVPVSLKELMTQVVKSKDISILPERFNAEYFRWIDNLRPWCISRQIWYGHRIPVWYRNLRNPHIPPPMHDTNDLDDSTYSLPDCEEIYVGVEPPQGNDWEQDPDTLDTWFSSGLWSFSTLGWPNNINDLQRFHPTTVLETGYDILFFWVARMVLMSTYLLGQVPFKTVYLHGMVRASDGQKMSKSLGNSASDPLEIIEKYGSDSLRMAMIVGNGPGQDIKLAEEKIKAYGKFANKLWNITRYVLENADITKQISRELIEQDDWSKMHDQSLRDLIAEITPEMETFKFYLVSEKLYHYIWHSFADIIIEESKHKLQDTATAQIASSLLVDHLTTCITLLHPFMPHVTETIWQLLPTPWKHNKQTILMMNRWPM